MPLIRRTCAAALLMPMLAVSAHAQVSRLPMEVQEVLAALGPKWGTALRENIDATAAAFRPLLKAAPKDGVIVGKNLAYGEDAKQILDVYQPIWRTSAPIVIFIHGGAYVRGDKDIYGRCTATSLLGSPARACWASTRPIAWRRGRSGHLPPMMCAGWSGG
jgi:acetyl esterase/lipase